MPLQKKKKKDRPNAMVKNRALTSLIRRVCIYIYIYMYILILVLFSIFSSL